MTEKQRRAQMANELSEIVIRAMRDAGSLSRIAAALINGKPLGPIRGVLIRYDQNGQAYAVARGKGVNAEYNYRAENHNLTENRAAPPGTPLTTYRRSWPWDRT